MYFDTKFNLNLKTQITIDKITNEEITKHKINLTKTLIPKKVTYLDEIGTNSQLNLTNILTIQRK